MAMKFFIILCLAVLLQDTMGNLARRSYNPRFRNINRKYSNGFDDSEIVEEMFVVDTNPQKLTKTDVILVSMPLENSLSANELPEHHHKHKHSQHNPGHHKNQKPDHSAFLDAEATINRESKPIVLQLLGFAGNPPQPMAFPPMPIKSSEMAPAKPEMESVAVPIVIEEEIIQEIKPVSAGAMAIDSMIVQDVKQESSEKPVEQVEIKIKNEEPLPASQDKDASPSENIAKPIEVKITEESKKPVADKNESENKTKLPSIAAAIYNKLSSLIGKPSVAVEALPQGQMASSASGNSEKQTLEVESIKKDVVKTPVKVDVISEVMPLMKESEKPVPEMIVENGDKKEVSEAKPEMMEMIAQAEGKKEVSEKKPEMMESVNVADIKIDVLDNEMKKEESPVMAVMIPDSLPMMMEPMPMQSSVPSEIKNKISEAKVEKIEPTIFVEKQENPQKSDKVIEVASYILEKAPENLPMQDKIEEILIPAMNSENKIPAETEKLKEDIIMVVEESIPEKQQIVISTEKKSDVPEPMIADIVVEESSLPMAKPEEIIVQVPLKISEKESSMHENASPMIAHDMIESKPEEVKEKAPLQINESSPIVKDKEVSKPEEIKNHAPIQMIEKETPTLENSSPAIKDKESVKPKPDKIELQSVLQKLVSSDLKTKLQKQSVEVVQKQINVESKLDSKIPEEKLPIQEPEVTKVQETEVLLSAAKPALVENDSKKDHIPSGQNLLLEDAIKEMIAAENPKKETAQAVEMDVMVEHGNHKGKPRPHHKPGKRPHKHHKNPTKKPASSTSVPKDSETTAASVSTSEAPKILVSSNVPDLGF